MSMDADTTTLQLAFPVITGVQINFNNVPDVSAAASQPRLTGMSDK